MNETTAKRIGTFLAALTFLAVAIACAAVGWFLCSALSGCASLPEEGVSFTVTASPAGLTVTPAGDAVPDAPALDPAATPSGPAGDNPPSTNPPANPPDGVDFSSLAWCFGGFNGADAALSSPRIASLSVDASGLSFKWLAGLSAWGLADDDPSAIAALFVQDSRGRWLGGKFEWISTSRSSRSFTNVFSGYNGWSLADVPNPTRLCFLVVSKDGKLRSNVLGPVFWSRD